MDGIRSKHLGGTDFISGTVGPVISDGFRLEANALTTNDPQSRVALAFSGHCGPGDPGFIHNPGDPSPVDPLVLDLDGDGIELTSFVRGTVRFDVDNDGYAEQTGWVTKDDGILVHDLSQNGKIDDITETISEYYGAKSGTRQFGQDSAGNGFKTGFDALISLDKDATGHSDGVFDNKDVAWSSLHVWKDVNHNGVTDAWESL